jgi:hypothetical protein
MICFLIEGRKKRKKRACLGLSTTFRLTSHRTLCYDSACSLAETSHLFHCHTHRHKHRHNHREGIRLSVKTTDDEEEEEEEEERGRVGGISKEELMNRMEGATAEMSSKRDLNASKRQLDSLHQKIQELQEVIGGQEALAYSERMAVSEDSQHLVVLVDGGGEGRSSTTLPRGKEWRMMREEQEKLQVAALLKRLEEEDRYRMGRRATHGMVQTSHLFSDSWIKSTC